MTWQEILNAATEAGWQTDNEDEMPLLEEEDTMDEDQTEDTDGRPDQGGSSPGDYEA